MATYFPDAYAPPGGDEPLTHARMLHSRNWLAGGTVAASNTASGFFANAPLNSLTYERWQPNSLGATWTYDHGAAATCDALCIAAHTIGTSAASVEVLTSDDDSAYTSRIGPIEPTDNEAIWCFLPLTTARYWRVEITGVTRPELGVIKFGRALQFPQPMFSGHTRARFARQTVLRSNITETGEFVGRTVQRVQRPTSYSWAHLPRTWTETNWPTLQRAVEAEPFFLSWRPASYGDVGYFQTDQVPEAVTMGVRDYYEAAIDVRGYSHD